MDTIIGQKYVSACGKRDRQTDVYGSVSCSLLTLQREEHLKINSHYGKNVRFITY